MKKYIYIIVHFTSENGETSTEANLFYFLDIAQAEHMLKFIAKSKNAYQFRQTHTEQGLWEGSAYATKAQEGREEFYCLWRDTISELDLPKSDK